MIQLHILSTGGRDRHSQGEVQALGWVRMSLHTYLTRWLPAHAAPSCKLDRWAKGQLGKWSQAGSGGRRGGGGCPQQGVPLKFPICTPATLVSILVTSDVSFTLRQHSPFIDEDTRPQKAAVISPAFRGPPHTYPKPTCFRFLKRVLFQNILFWFLYISHQCVFPCLKSLTLVGWYFLLTPSLVTRPPFPLSSHIWTLITTPTVKMPSPREGKWLQY